MDHDSGTLQVPDRALSASSGSHSHSQSRADSSTEPQRAIPLRHGLPEVFMCKPTQSQPHVRASNTLGDLRGDMRVQWGMGYGPRALPPIRSEESIDVTRRVHSSMAHLGDNTRDNDPADRYSEDLPRRPHSVAAGRRPRPDMSGPGGVPAPLPPLRRKKSPRRSGRKRKQSKKEEIGKWKDEHMHVPSAPLLLGWGNTGQPVYWDDVLTISYARGFIRYYAPLLLRALFFMVVVIAAWSFKSYTLFYRESRDASPFHYAVSILDLACTYSVLMSLPLICHRLVLGEEVISNKLLASGVTVITVACVAFVHIWAYAHKVGSDAYIGFVTYLVAANLFALWLLGRKVSLYPTLPPRTIAYSLTGQLSFICIPPLYFMVFVMLFHQQSSFGFQLVFRLVIHDAITCVPRFLARAQGIVAPVGTEMISWVYAIPVETFSCLALRYVNATLGVTHCAIGEAAYACFAVFYRVTLPKRHNLGQDFMSRFILVSNDTLTRPPSLVQSHAVTLTTLVDTATILAFPALYSIFDSIFGNGSTVTIPSVGTLWALSAIQLAFRLLVDVISVPIEVRLSYPTFAVWAYSHHSYTLIACLFGAVGTMWALEVWHLGATAGNFYNSILN